MKTVRLFAVSLWLTLPAAGAAAEPAGRYLAGKNELSGNAPETITRRQAAEDTEFFAEIMRGGYAALATLREKDRGAGSFLSGLAEKARTLPEPVSVEALLDTLAGPLGVFRDPHLSLSYRRADGSYSARSPTPRQRAYLLAPPEPYEELVSCGGMEGARLRYPFLRKDGEGVAVSSAMVFFSPRQEGKIDCAVRRGGRLVEAAAKLRRHRFDPDERDPVFFMQDGDVPVLRLGSLDLGRTGDMDAFVRSAVKLRSSQSFVLDVRGNHGGSDLSVDAWLETLSGPDGLKPEEKGASRFLLGPVTLQGLLNSIAGLGDSPQVQKLSEFVRGKQKGVGASQTPVFVNADKFWGKIVGEINVPADKAAAAYRGSVVILADSVCASSCEDLVVKLRGRLKARVLLVGQNTSGTGDYGELGTYVLPHSRIRVMLSTTQYKNGPGFTEGRGYLPDFWIAEEDPLPAAKAAAFCLRDKNCAMERLGFGAAGGL